jgi:hypothetical protein
VNAEEFKCFEEAYLALLKLPYGKVRADNQKLLAELLSIVAEAMGSTEEKVQNYYEWRARC